MTKQEFDFWKEQFDELLKREDAANQKMIDWAEKFGTLAESLKSPPWYSDKNFWGKAIIALAVLIIGIYSVKNNGCFYIKDIVQFGNCPVTNNFYENK